MVNSDVAMVSRRQRLFWNIYKSKFGSTLYGKLAGTGSVLAFSDSLNDFFMNYMPVGADILEVGSGPGLQAIELVKKRPDIKLVASDFSDQFVQLGLANLSKWRQQNRQSEQPSTDLSLMFVQANAMDLSSFAANSFDGIYSITAIKHFPDPIRGITECIRCLKPGGRLLFLEFYKECSIETMSNLIRHFSIPRFLKPFMAHFIHHNLQCEAPSIEDVKNWLSVIKIPDSQKNLQVLNDYPAWLFTVIK